MLRGFCILALALCALAAPPKKRAPKLKFPVKPSEEIELRVRAEIEKAEAIARELTHENLFASAYLVSALYYRDGFLEGYPEERPDANPARRIIAALSRTAIPEWKARYVDLLHARFAALTEAPPAAPFLVPVEMPPPAPVKPGAKRRRRRIPHQTAIDLFVSEGSPVRSATRGLVVLAENGWTAADPFSTSSMAGGNCAIVFDPGAARFLRYCHLGWVNVQPGAVVSAGQSLGVVGNTGMNASRKGHGQHLHFEINTFDGLRTSPFSYAQLRDLIAETAVRAAAAP
jgi:murein DD-endopeptidase MepM/ murein hydrolase activator NlpD